MQHKIWTASNCLSFLRVVLIVPVVYLITHPTAQNDFIAVILCLAAGLTDLFDGALARAMNQVTELGRIIDPLADKLCVAVVVGVLAFQGKIPLWFLTLALVRDLAIFVGGLNLKKKLGVIVESNQAGKWAVAFTSFVVLVTVLNASRFALLQNVFIAISTVLLAISSVQYYMRYRKLMGDYRGR